MLLQIEHLSLRVLMSVVMPGQYMDDFALAVMPVIPWCAAWSASRQVGRSEVGMTIRSPMQITSSTMLRLPITVQYACMEAGIEDLSVVMPSSIQNIRSCSEGSDVVATWSCSQSMGIDEIAAHIAFCRFPIAETEATAASWLAGQSWLGLGMSSGRCS